MTLLFTARVPVRWIDQDLLGHVNNAAYFTYFEQARIEAMESLGVVWVTAQHGPVLVATSAQFKRAVKFPATLLVRVFAKPPGNTSLTHVYEVATEADPHTLCATGEATMVWIDLQKERPIPLPPAVRIAVEGQLNGA